MPRLHKESFYAELKSDVGQKKNSSVECIYIVLRMCKYVTDTVLHTK